MEEAMEPLRTIIGSRLNERARLNIAGVIYEARMITLLKYPQTRLGSLATKIRRTSVDSSSVLTLCDDYDEETGEMFFERDPTAFPAILNYYVSGHLHLPRSDCVKAFEEEVMYWGIPFDMGPCCDSYYFEEWACAEAIKKADQLEISLKKKEKNSEPETSDWKTIQAKIWNLFENPETSLAAKVVSVISNLVVILSTVILCLNTHPDLQTTAADGTKEDNPHLATIELVCIIWFTIEYVARLISCPNKKKFLIGGLNIIDLLTVLPYHIGKIIAVTTGGISLNFKNTRRFIQILRTIRIVRIFKLARHSIGLQVLGYTLKESCEELGLLALLLMMGVTLFATLVYYAEEHVPGTPFKSIIEGFWWATISITTVGYGDINPVTTFGKIIGCICCVSGILFIALPIPTIVGISQSSIASIATNRKLSFTK
ncbi:potassium voltage-gated channel subfamily B member 1-like [Rhopilema esculentum]|uniref:potassium voltage-gated channel subfamily B member 1-like n=1 Tax=Rhopilema esculentum TaxID=499914 RepID=UPI0031D25648